MKYSFKFYPTFDVAHVRAHVLRYIASLEEAVNAEQSEMDAEILQTFVHAERIAVSVYEHSEPGHGIIDLHFHKTGRDSRFYFVGLLYEPKDGGTISIHQHHPVSF